MEKRPDCCRYSVSSDKGRSRGASAVSAVASVTDCHFTEPVFFFLDYECAMLSLTVLLTYFLSQRNYLYFLLNYLSHI